MQTLGERVAYARKLAGMTQPDLSYALREHGESLDAADISRIENGYTKTPNVQRMAALCRALGVSGGYLLGLEPYPGVGARGATPPGADHPAGDPLAPLGRRPRRSDREAG